MSAHGVDGVDGVQAVKGTGPECRHVWALIDALGEGDPSPQALAEIGDHFAQCAGCAEAEQSLEELLVRYRGPGNISIPGGLEERLLDCLCGGKKEPGGPVRFHYRKYVNRRPK